MSALLRYLKELRLVQNIYIPKSWMCFEKFIRMEQNEIGTIVPWNSTFTSSKSGILLRNCNSFHFPAMIMVQDKQCFVILFLNDVIRFHSCEQIFVLIAIGS